MYSKASPPSSRKRGERGAKNGGGRTRRLRPPWGLRKGREGGRKTTAGVLEGFAPGGARARGREGAEKRQRMYSKASPHGGSQTFCLLSDSGLRPSLARQRGEGENINPQSQVSFENLVANILFGRKAKPCSAEVVDFVANPPQLRPPLRSSPPQLSARLSAHPAPVPLFVNFVDFRKFRVGGPVHRTGLS